MKSNKEKVAMKKLTVTLTTIKERDSIYRLRHDVYANELNQHSPNVDGRLSDKLDEANVYFTAKADGKVAGFISITPPASRSYSIDKYFSRDTLPFDFNNGLYEVRLLTVVNPFRGSITAGLLMYAAFRWIEENGGTRIVAIGRREVLDLYLKVGLKSLGQQVKAGAVTYELLSETTDNIIRKYLSKYKNQLEKLREKVNWQLEIPFYGQDSCYHGGTFFKAVGEEFDNLDRRNNIINADVLDAWYPPSPKVIRALQQHLPWLLYTSPPTNCEGMLRTIARVRNIDPGCILPGAGSSDLIFLALRQWLNLYSKVLILDPTYGEYAHILEKIIGCEVDRFALSRNKGYVLDSMQLKEKLNANCYDMVIIVNPNSPTGHYVPREELESVFRHVSPKTLVWVDETYVEYVGPGNSLEYFASQRDNVIVCKSMSKVYALSGLRAAYICTSAKLIRALKRITPPWAVSLPAQIAAVKALQDPGYYMGRYKDTHLLRNELAVQLKSLDGLDIVPGVANFLLCHLPEDGPDAATILNRCQKYGLYLRDVTAMGTSIGRHAFRIAVKDKDTNRRMIGILGKVLQKEAMIEN
ncbi:aminotransferase class I/II-fold pyridoxal phosphate-dependent enzyme [Candidatus Omnitrophota bacterium]